MTSRTYIVITALCIGCASDPDAFELVNAAPADASATQLAIDAWCEVGKCIHLESNASSSISFIDSLEGGYIGLTIHRADDASDILIARGATASLTIAHELGHHFGCRDSDDERDIMRDTRDASEMVALELTDADIACATKGEP